MKRSLVLVLGLFMISAGLSFAREGKVSEVAFTLAAIGSDPAPIPFTLAPRLTEPTALAGPGGAGVIEDPNGTTAVGWEALGGNTGGANTAIGYQALRSGGGSSNTATGYKSLLSCFGNYNTATGAEIGGILFWLGDYNTATGYAALQQNAGNYNTATGASALSAALSSDGNTAIGYKALANETYGRGYNTALGFRAGINGGTVPMGGFAYYNIYIGANQEGDFFDTSTIRIGLPYNSSVDPPAGQNRTFVAGIVENPIDGSLNPSVVGITSDARLGTIPVASLPVGPQGPTGPMGPAGPGLVSGSLLLLHSNVAPPAGYTLLGSTAFLVMQPNKKPTMLNINIYMKQ